MTITDMHTKRVKLRSGKTTYTAEDWAKAYFNQVSKTMRIPLAKFPARFRTHLTKLEKIDMTSDRS